MHSEGQKPTTGVGHDSCSFSRCYATFSKYSQLFGFSCFLITNQNTLWLSCGRIMAEIQYAIVDDLINPFTNHVICKSI